MESADLWEVAQVGIKEYTYEHKAGRSRGRVRARGDSSSEQDHHWLKLAAHAFPCENAANHMRYQPRALIALCSTGEEAEAREAAPGPQHNGKASVDNACGWLPVPHP